MQTERRKRMRNRVVLLAVVVLGSAACGRESLPKLPAGAAGEERAAADAATMSMPAGAVTYRFDGDGSDLPEKATAYELGRVGDVPAALRKPAAAFGLSGEVKKRDRTWVLRDDERKRELGVHDLPGLPWSLGHLDPCAGVPESDVRGGDIASCAVTVEAEPAAPPSREQVEATTRPVFERLGVGTEGLEVFDRTAVVRPRVGGRRTVGFEHAVHLGSDGRVLGANGWLGPPEALGEYPLVGLDEGLERLRTDWGFGARTLAADAIEPAIAPAEPTGPQEVVLTGVELGLQLVEGHLVPAYLFRVGDGDGPTVPAVAEEYLEGITPRPEPHPEPVPPDGGSGCGVSGQSSSEDTGNEPMTVEVCGPSEAKVGQEVVFEVTATDPDAEILDDGCGGPMAWFGDEGDGVAVGECMPACAAPLKQGQPGKLARTFRHVYTESGTYTARFTFRSAFCTTGSSRGEGTHTVVVR